MIDVASEQLRLLNEAPPIVPGRPHLSTLIRWSKRGVRGVRLETLVVGGRRFTSVEAIARFLARLNADHSTGRAAAAPQAQPMIEQVEKQLDAEGIK
jgi:hypothetical protein